MFSALLILVVLSAFFSSSETAMMALNRYRLRHMVKTGHKGARRAAKLLKRPDQLLGLILIGNNLVNNAAAALAGLIAFQLFGEAAVAIATLVLTFVMLVFAEVTPKTIAAYHPERIAFPASLILQPLMIALWPAIWVVNHMSGFLVRLSGGSLHRTGEDALSAEELRTLVGTINHRIPDRNQGMLVNILDLEEVVVDDIMVPRNEIVGIDLDDSDEKIAAQLLHSEYTRLPVYNADINNIIGILHLRNAATLFSGGSFARQKLKSLLTPPYFIPENTPLHTQLHNFQRQKHRVGVVVDEYGAVLGLVALEDILEEIVGDFVSDIADTNEDIRRQGDGSYLIDGTTTVRDINKALQWQLPTEGPRTLNGLLLEELEAIPQSSIGVRIRDYCFEITQTGDNRIKEVRAFTLGSLTGPTEDG
jgi:Mg2+/Co2+ transporter CorB